jgi:hypothetical protein
MNSILSVIYLARRNNLNINTIQKILKLIKEKIQYNIVNYCTLKYQNNIFHKYAKMLNKNTNNVKIAFKTNNNLIKHTNNITIKCPLF